MAPHEDKKIDQLSNNYLICENHLAIANFAGLPSISIPIGFKDSLPLGATFTSKAFDEKNLFKIASALEKQLPFKNQIAKETD